MDLHAREQSASVACVQPNGQHASEVVEHLVTAGPLVHSAWQPEPRSTASKQVLAGVAQVVGHAPSMPAGMAVSHSSEPSTTPLPHTSRQSASVRELQPAGQHPSPTDEQRVTAL